MYLYDFFEVVSGYFFFHITSLFVPLICQGAKNNLIQRHCGRANWSEMRHCAKQFAPRFIIHLAKLSFRSVGNNFCTDKFFIFLENNHFSYPTFPPLLQHFCLSLPLNKLVSWFPWWIINYEKKKCVDFFTLFLKSPLFSKSNTFWWAKRRYFLEIVTEWGPLAGNKSLWEGFGNQKPWRTTA